MTEMLTGERETILDSSRWPLRFLCLKQGPCDRIKGWRQFGVLRSDTAPFVVINRDTGTQMIYYTVDELLDDGWVVD